MPNNFFLSGLPKAGKTTLLHRLIKKLESEGYSIGGFISPEIKEHGTREGFYVEDIATGKTALLASLSGGGPRVSKYYVDVKSFESVALEFLRNTKKYDVIIIDEIGRMELESEKFANALENVLNGPTPVIASLHHNFIPEYEYSGEVYPLTETNRNSVEVRILDGVLQVLKMRKQKEPKKPKEQAKKSEEPKIELPKPAEKPVKKKIENKVKKKDLPQKPEKMESQYKEEKTIKTIMQKEKPREIQEIKKEKTEQKVEIKKTQETKKVQSIPKSQEEKKPEKKESIFDKIKKIFKR